jgi:trehalose 6-phosphate phosphatase
LISDADSNSEPTRTDTSHSPGNGRLRFVDGDSEVRIAPDGDALFLDVDGTLLEIAHHPDAVSVPPPLVAALDHLARRFGGALALISGRSIENLDALFAPLRLPCAGVHGLERRDAAAVVHRDDATALLAPLRAPLADFVRAHAGLLLEDKGQSLALHFRKAPACASDAEALLRRLISAGGSSLELKRGKMVLEVTPGNADKGTAIAAFLQEPPFAGRRPVFIGDDVTDEDGFAVVNAQDGLAIRVGHDHAPSAARHRLLDEAAVIAWLLRWAGDAADGERR